MLLCKELLIILTACFLNIDSIGQTVANDFNFSVNIVFTKKSMSDVNNSVVKKKKKNTVKM